MAIEVPVDTPPAAKPAVPPQLSTALLKSLQANGNTVNNNTKVSLPQYDPQQLQPGIVHIGVGNFHRSHLATYMHDLHNINSTASSSWGILGAGVMPGDAVKRNMLEPQNWLQTLVQRDGNNVQATILASMVGFVPVVPANSDTLSPLARVLRDPQTKIVSLTVTEGGYFLDAQGHGLDQNHAAIRAEISNPECPHTIFGLLVQALEYRRKRNMPVFTILSCDNIPHNGDVVRNVVLGLAESMHNQDLADWIGRTVAFPNSMVDRITPGTTADMITHVQDEYGYRDAAPVFCEPFRQWVLEDKFSQGRPDWHILPTVSFVNDVAPYELMKIRILNGGHASLCYPAALLDLEYVHEALEHPILRPFLEALERDEIIPTVPPVPNTSLAEYWNTVAERFSNPTIGDTISRICFDGSSRQPKFIIPVARDALQQNNTKHANVHGLAMVSALWCRYCCGTTESGRTIAANDPQWDRLQTVAQAAMLNNPGAWLDMADIYEPSVGEHPVFRAAFGRALEQIQTLGVAAALQAYCQSSSSLSTRSPSSTVDILKMETTTSSVIGQVAAVAKALPVPVPPVLEVPMVARA